MRKWLPLLIVCLLTGALRGYCQDVPLLHYTIDDGLPSNKVYSIYRDHKGYIWATTDKGITRFNGIRFETFTTFNGLPDNEVFFVNEDPWDRLWLATYSGELCYFKDDTFHTAANTPELRLPFKTPFIRRIAIERDSSITFLFRGYPNIVNFRNHQFRTYSLDKVRALAGDHEVIECRKLADFRFEVTSPDDVVEIDTAGNLLSRRPHDMPGNGTEDDASWKMSFTQGQDFILGKHYVFNREGMVVHEFSDTFRNRNNVYVVYHNNLGYFTATNNGVDFNGQQRLMRGYQVSCLTQDIQGNYWASTLENGIFSFDHDFRSEHITKDAYIGKVTYATSSGEHLYFVTSAFSVYDLVNGSARPVFNFNGYVSQESRVFNTYCYLIEPNGRFTYFNRNAGYVAEDLARQGIRFKQYLYDHRYSGLIKKLVTCGTQQFANAGYTVLGFRPGSASGDMLPMHESGTAAENEKIYGFEAAPDSSLWYSTPVGVYRVKDTSRTALMQFKDRPFKNFCFFGQWLVGYTYQDRFFICSDYDKTNPFFDSLVEGHNCIWDKFYRLDDKHLLISTNNNYRLLSFPDLKMTIVDNAFMPPQPEAIVAANGNICFFKNGAITAMDLGSFLKPSDPPRLFFTRLRAGSAYYPIRNETNLPFDHARSVSIAFATLSFSGKNVSYLYSVSKDKDNWQPLSGEEINLVNSGSGYYTIKVKAKTSASVYSAPIAFTLYIERPFWASWWFITLSLWLVAGTLAWGVRERLRRIVRKKDQAHLSEIKYLRSEYKAMNALMNPHFIFNTLNNVQSLVNANDKAAANEYLRIFADLVRQNMHNIARELIPLQREIELVSNYLSLEKLRFEDKLSYSIEVGEELDLSEIMIPPLLIQPLVENSIKHGILPLHDRPGIIKLMVYEKSNLLYIEVRDNGVGMNFKKKEKSSNHESYGLQNIRHRVEQLGKLQNKHIDFLISEEKEPYTSQNWTVVTIRIPLGEV